MTYAYAPSGLRVSKTVDGRETEFVLDGDQVVLELVSDAVTAYYVRGINLIYSAIGSTTNYYLYNGHGDVVQLTDVSGAVTKEYDYDAFGNEKEIDTADTNPFRYCGEYYDAETGTYYLSARYYDPVVGRFTQQDTYAGDSNDPLSLNLYTYCNNNPIMFIDPSGHIAAGPSAAGLLSGAAATAAGTALAGNSLNGNSLYGNSLYGNSLYGNSLYGNSLYGNSTTSGSSIVKPGSITISTSPASPDPDDDDDRNWQSIKEKYLEKQLGKQGTDPHEVKYEYLGKKTQILYWNGWISIMDRTTVIASFTLIGNDFDINYVTETLNIYPTYFRDKDELLGNGRKFGHTEWGIGTDLEESIDINVQLNKIIMEVKDKTDLLNKVRIKCNADWSILVSIKIENGETPAMYLSKQFVNFLSEIEAEIGFDVYVYSARE